MGLEDESTVPGHLFAAGERAPDEVDTAVEGRPGGEPVIRPSIPSRLGRYVILRLLGRGGVGEVYEANDPELGRKVALKVLREDRVGDTVNLRREAQALARLHHAHVISVYDVGVAAGDVYVVMQLIAGETLDVWLAARVRPTEEIMAMFRQAGEGLAAAHAAELVHCDFKPGNVLVDHAGVARVGDFGLARKRSARTGDAGSSDTATLLVAGTPAYMAPEQFDGVVIAASDQFAFCAALWEALGGARPFDDPPEDLPDGDTIRSRVLRPPLRPIPPAIAAVLERGLAATPDQRFPSMRALLDSLAVSPRRRWVWVAEVVGVAIVAVGIVVAVRYATRDDDVPAEAPREGALVTWQLPDAGPQRAVTKLGEGVCAYAPTIVGSDVVFDRSEGHVTDLYAVPLAGGTPRQLTTGPEREWRAAQGRTPGEVVYLVQPTTGTDGAAIAYLDVATGVSTLALATLAYGAVASGDSLYFTPDRPPSIRRVTGRSNEAVTALPDQNYNQLAVSPRGDRLAVASTDASSVCVIDLVTHAAPACWTTDGADARPAFGMDGHALYYGGRGGIHRRELATGADVIAVPDSAIKISVMGGLAVTPDGSELLYSACSPRSKILDVTATQVLVDEPNSSQPAFARDGSMAWVRMADTGQLLVVRSADGVETVLTAGAIGFVEAPSFAPDGARIAFRVTGTGAGVFVIKRATPGSPLQLTDNPLDRAPVFTAHGEIAFERGDAAGNRRVYAISADGGAPRVIGTSTRSLYGIRGDELLVGTTDGLYWLDITTGTERRGPEKPPGYLLAAAVSPSGTWIMFQMGPDGQDLWRARLDAPEPPERVVTYPDSDTLSLAGIRDDGHVIAAPGHWAGDIYAIAARPGSPF